MENFDYLVGLISIVVGLGLAEGHTKLESTVRYLGVELDDALALSEALEI